MSFLQRLTGGSRRQGKARYGKRRLRFERLEERTLKAMAAGDFDNDGIDDLAVGVPDENYTYPYECIGSCEPESEVERDVGVVNVMYGYEDSLRPVRGLRGPYAGRADEFGPDPWDGSWRIGEKAGVHFGHALAVGDFDGNGSDDLAVGAPDDGNGSVTVIYGRDWIEARGLEPGLCPDYGRGYVKYWHLRDGTRDEGELPFGAYGDDQFGHSLAAGDFNGDGVDDLAVGACNFGPEDAGAVFIIYGQYGRGLILSADQPADMLNQDDAPGDGPEREDHFGFSLAVGNFNGDVRCDAHGIGRPIDDLVVGVPHENIELSPNHGAVHVFYGSERGVTTHDAVTWEGERPGDKFGWSVAAGSFRYDERDWAADRVPRYLGYDDLAVGIPGHRHDAGAVQVIYGTRDGLPPGRCDTTGYLSQDYLRLGTTTWPRVEPIYGESTEGDQFGYALAVGHFTYHYRADPDSPYYEEGLRHFHSHSLVIGAPGKYDGRGEVYVVASTRGGMFLGGRAPSALVDPEWPRTLSRDWDPSRMDPNTDEDEYGRFGDSLVTGDFNNKTREDPTGRHWYCDDLVVGVPEAKVRGKSEAGSLALFEGFWGHRLIFCRYLDQEDLGTGEGTEKKDHFGSAGVWEEMYALET